VSSAPLVLKASAIAISLVLGDGDRCGCSSTVVGRSRGGHRWRCGPLSPPALRARLTSSASLIPTSRSCPRGRRGADSWRRFERAAGAGAERSYHPPAVAGRPAGGRRDQLVSVCSRVNGCRSIFCRPPPGNGRRCIRCPPPPLRTDQPLSP
jgi:hypothetical protein